MGKPTVRDILDIINSGLASGKLSADTELTIKASEPSRISPDYVWTLVYEKGNLSLEIDNPEDRRMLLGSTYVYDWVDEEPTLKDMLENDPEGLPEGYPYRKVPLTPEQVEDEREESLHLAKVYGRKIDKFTCDGCALTSTCVFAFDHYNTDGDCLLEK